MRDVPLLVACVLATAAAADTPPPFDIQGHRGARGLMPENTLAGFAAALSIGVTTLEMDVGVTRDGVVVVRHDRRLNPAIVRGGDGGWIGRRDRRPLSEVTFAQLQRFDVGRLDPRSGYAARFPSQQARDGERIPRLRDVIDLAQRAGNDGVRFSIETKLSPLAPGETLTPPAFAEAVVGVLREAGVVERSSIQSFDWRTLQHVQRIAPEVATVYLTAQGARFDTVQAGRSGASPWTAGFDVDAHGGSVPRLVAEAGGRIWSTRAADLTDVSLRGPRAGPPGARLDRQRSGRDGALRRARRRRHRHRLPEPTAHGTGPSRPAAAPTDTHRALIPATDGCVPGCAGVS